MTPEANVTVVVPTFGRAHLLLQTIPSYLQPEVAELILVDDCSPDDTPAVAKELMARYPHVRYLRNEKNLKQTVSKNRGKAQARTEYIYFGDDDSILSEGGIARLLQTARDTGSDIVGACALYMKSDSETMSQLIAQRKPAASVHELVDLSRLHFDFTRTTPAVWEVPVCQASFLGRSQVVKRVDFDPGYIGNCFREETDYLLRCKAQNATIVYDSRVTQVNLPPSIATGGARGRSRALYEAYALYNTMRFAVKNRAILRQVDPACRPGRMVYSYMRGRLDSVVAKLSRSA